MKEPAQCSFGMGNMLHKIAEEMFSKPSIKQ